MQLQYIYRADINRDINGVIKVAQNDERSIEQELREYIITRELRRHFNTFLNNYERSLTSPTDKIGVWISGFFGSGKSHFLKILSYLLSNDTVAGKKAVDYFADKFDDPMMFAQLERCAGVPTDTILFNIDSKSPINKDKTAILRVFAKVFYEYRGFYGDDLKVAKLEQFIEKSGKLDAFKAKFEEIHGDSWEDSRDAFSFFEDDVVDSLIEVLGMSETAARNWFNGTETADMSIEQLVREIKEYIDSKGKDFHLLFMIDEVGQYIGSDGSLMLNLQTIVEEIGSKCGGRVWVMVTSQEAIDSITKISGDDFSKIQGRFNTRLSLSSSSVDEVIKKRILAKTDNAANMLALSYSKNSAVLKNLFTFNDAVLDLKGYAGENDFIETYPFVPYQFRLMQNVLAQIRKHGNSGKHLSGGERSMLSGFQEAAQAIEDKDENALVPFCLFYNTVHTFLESAIRRVIDRCQTAADNHDGIEQYDVSVLKLLYLIRYVDDIKANVDNITTLMVDDIRADKITMRKQIQKCLDRLVHENYIARNGDTYTFLTDDEQDIERDIRNTPVDSAAIVQSIATIVFGDLYVSKKFKYGKYDFAYDQIIDDTLVLNLISPTLNYNENHIGSIPVLLPLDKDTIAIVEQFADSCVCYSKCDWDSFETSWDFQQHPLVGRGVPTVAEAYALWEAECLDRFNQIKANEEELNRIFIDIYGLQDELTPEVEDKDVTVRRADLGRDIRSFISYAVGCMFGRYSLCVPGLLYAGGQWDYEAIQQQIWDGFGKHFASHDPVGKYEDLMPDQDGILPISDDEYFGDDIVGRFVQFVETVFGKDTLEENLRFIAKALGGKGTPREVIRSYFLNDFYADHLKIYQKRPIYWLFSSGKKNGFKCLIYMHRYQPDLLARIRTDYVHEQQERYRTQLTMLEDSLQTAGASERVKLNKQIAKIKDQALELQKYEEKIHHLADQMISIDLDDGVKVNYAKFQDVLEKIK